MEDAKCVTSAYQENTGLNTGWSKSLCVPDDYSTNSVYANIPHKIDEFKMDFTKYIRNVDRAILNTVFANTFRRDNKYMESGERNL